MEGIKQFFDFTGFANLTTGHLIMITIGILFIYLAIRNIGKGEDYRYQEFRQKFGPERYWWFSFFQTFLLQGILIMLVSLPLLGANYNSWVGICA